VATDGTTYGNDGSVYVADADGRHGTAITDPGSTWNLRWSPDGQWIAYDDGDPRTVWVVHPDGGDPHELVSAGDGYWSFGPVWSPDGGHVLFMRSQSEFDASTLWVAGIDGSDPTRLTKRTDLYTAYAWIDAGG
jgi:Tol biopolymer transport system component